MKRYEEYKQTSVEFLEEVPKHWEEKRMRFIGYLYGGLSGKSANDFNKTGNENNKHFIPFTNIANNLVIDPNNLQTVVIKASEKQNQVKNGDLFFLMSSENYDDVGKSAVLNDEIPETYLNSFCKGFRITEKEIDSKFLNYQLHSKQHRHNLLTGANGFTRINLKIDKVKDLFTAIPPTKEEQTEIANYLDKKTAEIDKLIADKKQLVELYQEEKTGIINQAVNKGINPDIKLKESGIEWLSDIPEHWEVKKLKYSAKMQGGYAFSSKDFVSEGIQLLKIANLYNNELHLERQPTYLPESFITSHQNWLVSDEDILLSMTGTLGKRDYGFAILIANTGAEFLLNQRVSKIHSVKNIKKELLLSVLHSEYFLNNLFSIPSGTKQGNFSNEDVLNIEIAYPKLFEEQTQIIQYIKKESARIDTKIAKAEKYINLLTEYRTALISEVVTGKIKIID